MPAQLDQYPDMSDYVVHFTKDYGGATPYANVMSILHSRRIQARNPFGIARKQVPDPSTQLAACLSEIPPHCLKRLADKRGDYGLAFRKDFLVGRGGGPVLYAYKDTPHYDAIRALIHAASGKPDAPIWKLTPFIEAPGKYPTGEYYFEWEREWRHLGHIDFDVSDVAFLVIPEEQHEQARGFFEDARRENLGPAYYCPHIDPRWGRAQVNAALEAETTDPEPPKKMPSCAN